MNLKIHIDGGARGNPGPAATGVVIHDADDDAPIHEAGYFLGKTTNNVAEYSGLIHALEIAARLKAASLDIYSDSQLMVRQINGQYRVKNQGLKPLFAKARRLLDGFDRWTITDVRRERNTRADELANLAMDLGRDVVEFSAEGFEA